MLLFAFLFLGGGLPSSAQEAQVPYCVILSQLGWVNARLFMLLRPCGAGSYMGYPGSAGGMCSAGNRTGVDTCKECALLYSLLARSCTYPASMLCI